jgi:hypothetical protein
MCGASISIPESLDENELIGVFQAPGPLEPEVARFVAGGLGEIAHASDPFCAAFWADVELHNDRNHELPFV